MEKNNLAHVELTQRVVDFLDSKILLVTKSVESISHRLSLLNSESWKMDLRDLVNLVHLIDSVDQQSHEFFLYLAWKINKYIEGFSSVFLDGKYVYFIFTLEVLNLNEKLCRNNQSFYASMCAMKLCLL